jgi:hypothetical protein
MKRKLSKTVLNILSPFAAAFLFPQPALFADMFPAGGDYQMESSMLDSGGGGNMTGGEYSAKGSAAQNYAPDNLGVLSGGEYVNRAGFYNPPHFTYQSGLTTVLPMSSNAQLSFPPDSVDKRVFDITVNKDPLGRPMIVDPEKINEAIRKIVHNDGLWAQPGPNNLMEVTVFDEQGYYTKPLAKRGALAMRYNDANGDGIVDGSNPPVRVNTLTAWGLDETRNTWVELPGTNADRASQTVTAYFEAPGVYAMLGAQDLSISRNFKAYPVPFRPNGPQAGSGPGQTGTETDGITFENAPQGGNIEIYTLDGRLVRKIDIPGDLPMPYSVKWDVRTAAGTKTASGVYIWRVKSETDALTGKLMVIW